VITGVSSKLAVPGTALSAADRGYLIVVAEDCIAGTLEEVHAFMLKEVAHLLATITDSVDIMASLGKLRPRNDPKAKVLIGETKYCFAVEDSYTGVPREQTVQLLEIAFPSAISKNRTHNSIGIVVIRNGNAMPRASQSRLHSERRRMLAAIHADPLAADISSKMRT
jgi:hypothetical protein